LRRRRGKLLIGGGQAMILRRLSENLRAQNWTAMSIEFVILVIGVFLGVQASNWNQQRLERRETERMLVQLIPELESQMGFFDSAKDYYATTRRYADTALAGWNGDRSVSDEQFVIAAYQASQIYGIGTNAVNWTAILGGDQLRNIDDPHLRRNLGLVLSADYDAVSFKSVATPYREQVRHIIPIEVQDRIRNACGDRPPSDSQNLAILPKSCPLKLSPGEAASAAAALRARPDRPGELRWHLAAVAAFLANGELLDRPIRALHTDLLKRR
jgi:hypothetical protein